MNIVGASYNKDQLAKLMPAYQEHADRALSDAGRAYWNSQLEQLRNLVQNAPEATPVVPSNLEQQYGYLERLKTATRPEERDFLLKNIHPAMLDAPIQKEQFQTKNPGWDISKLDVGPVREDTKWRETDPETGLWREYTNPSVTQLSTDPLKGVTFGSYQAGARGSGREQATKQKWGMGKLLSDPMSMGLGDVVAATAGLGTAIGAAGALGTIGAEAGSMLGGSIGGIGGSAGLVGGGAYGGTRIAKDIGSGPSKEDELLMSRIGSGLLGAGLGTVSGGIGLGGLLGSGLMATKGAITGQAPTGLEVLGATGLMLGRGIGANLANRAQTMLPAKTQAPGLLDRFQNAAVGYGKKQLMSAPKTAVSYLSKQIKADQINKYRNLILQKLVAQYNQNLNLQNAAKQNYVQDLIKRQSMLQSLVRRQQGVANGIQSIG